MDYIVSYASWVTIIYSSQKLGWKMHHSLERHHSLDWRAGCSEDPARRIRIPFYDRVGVMSRMCSTWGRDPLGRCWYKPQCSYRHTPAGEDWDMMLQCNVSQTIALLYIITDFASAPISLFADNRASMNMKKVIVCCRNCVHWLSGSFETLGIIALVP